MPTIAIESEIAETLFDQFAAFIMSNPDWDADRVVSAAIASFLASQSEVLTNA